jgi:hypothetical protein
MGVDRRPKRVHVGETKMGQLQAHVLIASRTVGVKGLKVLSYPHVALICLNDDYQERSNFFGVTATSLHETVLSST